MNNIEFWEKQYRRNISRIFGICYLYTGDYSVAEDIAQDVFVKAMEKFHTIRAVLSFDSWLKRIAVNQCVDYLRQKPNFVPLPSEIADEITTTDETLWWTTDITEEELLDTIKQLPELQRTVFNLFAIEGYTHRRIAALLDITVPYSKQLHRRARVRLNKILSDKHIEKEKLKKGLSMAFLLSLMKKVNSNSRRIDRLYRSRFASFRMEPTHTLATSEIRHAAEAASPSKIGAVIAAHKTIVILVAATSVAGGAASWQVVQNKPIGLSVGNEPPLVETIDTSLLHNNTTSDTIAGIQHFVSQQTDTDSLGEVEVAHTTPQKIASPQAPSPTVVTKKVTVHKTVTIRDTTVTFDTVYRLSH